MKICELKQVVESYLKEEINYAIMIDGEWGCGKTYLLENELKSTIDGEVARTQEGSKRKKKIYISMYGIKATDEISKEIILQSLVGKNSGVVSKGLRILGSIISSVSVSSGGANIWIKPRKLAKLVNEIDIGNCIICVDDFERSHLPVTELLGYFNYLVEHCNCKMIILANESEIGKHYLSKNLESKYRISTILLDKDNAAEKDSTLNKKSLDEMTSELFGMDSIYKLTREKVIGRTIRYEPEMDIIFDSVVNRLFEKDTLYRNFLLHEKKDILKWMVEENCKNVRTLQFILKHIKIIFDKMEENQYDQDYHNYAKKIFIEFVVRYTIYSKKGENSERSKQLERMRGFDFLEKYCDVSYFSGEKFIESLNRHKNLYKLEQERLNNSNKEDAIKMLQSWWQFSSIKIDSWVTTLINELKEKEHALETYPLILDILGVLEYYDLLDEKKIESILEEMIQLEGVESDVYKDHVILKAFAENPGQLLEGYGKMHGGVVTPQKQILKNNWIIDIKDKKKYEQKYDTRIKRLKEKIYVSFEKSIRNKAEYMLENIDEESVLHFCHLFEEHSHYITETGKFIELIPIEALIEALRTKVEPYEIYELKNLFIAFYDNYSTYERESKILNDFLKRFESLETGDIVYKLAREIFLSSVQDRVESLQEEEERRKRIEKELYDQAPTGYS